MRAGIALTLATVAWLWTVHLFFVADYGAVFDHTAIHPKARELAGRHLRLWQDPELRKVQLERMRSSNAEWDFMGRTFLVLSLAEMTLREPDLKADHLAVMDRIIGETLRLEKKRTMYFFLMDYARVGHFAQQPPRSLFLDGEIALMLGARRLVAERVAYKEPFVHRIRLMVQRMDQGPVLSCESYPNECWMFCNAAALAALRMSDALDGTDHGRFARRWLARARTRLVDRATGLLVSSFRYDGTFLDGPEGSSIWFVAHCLRLVDPSFAREQYNRAKAELGARWAGFAWAREWPASWRGPADVDSGPVLPVLGVSAGSSGLYFLAAASFGDREATAALHATVDFAGFPLRREGGLAYGAGNQVGDAVLLYSMVQGPLWQEIERRCRR